VISLILASNLIGQSVQLKDSELRKLDTFASNFAETFTPPFANGRASDALMIDFALSHCCLNKQKDGAVKGGEIHFSRSVISSVIQRFFAKKVNLKRKEFSVPLADGETFPEARAFKVTGSYPKAFRLYCIEYVNKEGAGQSVTGADVAEIHRYVRIQARQSPTERGRFVIDSLAVLSGPNWKAESGVRTTTFVRPLP